MMKDDENMIDFKVSWGFALGLTDERTDRWTNRQMDEQMDGQMDGWTNRI